MTNPDFPDEVLEKILCKKMLSDKKYLSAVSDIFDSRWFGKDKNLGLLAKMSVSYFRKYAGVPGSQVLAAVIKKYCEKPGSALDCQALTSSRTALVTWEINVGETSTP